MYYSYKDMYQYPDFSMYDPNINTHEYSYKCMFTQIEILV